MKSITRLFFKGLAVMLPITLTAYILYWMGAGMERMAKNAILGMTGIEEANYLPGLGIVAGLAVVLLVGLLAEIWIFRKLLSLGEYLLLKIPLVRTIFGGLRDLMEFVSSASSGGLGSQTVMVDVGGDRRLMGIVTRQDFADLPDGLGNDKTVAVYLPMSYQIGGFTVFMPKEKAEPVDMPADDAMTFALTAAMSTGGAESKKARVRLAKDESGGNGAGRP